MNELIQHYQNYAEDDRLHKNRWNKIERLTTQKLLEPHLQNKSSVLELGAATGSYALHYAAQGHAVTAVDIVPEHVQQLRVKAEQQGLNHLKTFIADARVLSDCKDEEFDVVLCLGPYYHLRSGEERQACLRECLRVMKPGGILALAYINRFSAISYYFKAQLALTPELLNKLQEDDYTFSAGVDKFMDISHFSQPELIEKEIGEHPFEIIDHAGVDGIYSLYTEQLEEMKEELYETLCEYHLKICREPSILGMSAHGLLICKKTK